MGRKIRCFLRDAYRCCICKPQDLVFGTVTFALFAAVLSILPGLHAAAAAKRITWVGCCSDEGSLATPVLGSTQDLWHISGGAAPRASRTSLLLSSISSLNELVASRFMFGVCRSCPGGTTTRTWASCGNVLAGCDRGGMVRNSGGSNHGYVLRVGFGRPCNRGDDRSSGVKRWHGVHRHET